VSAPQLPAGLPPPPVGAVFLNKGGPCLMVPSNGDRFLGWSLISGGAEWEYGEWAGFNDERYYAGPIGSEIARLNGHGVEPAQPAADSEAVALVRKLRDELVSAINDSIKYPQLVIPQHQCNRIERMIRDANAFLAKEETKS